MSGKVKYPWIEKAYKLAAEAHADQTYSDGPYIEHLTRVASAFPVFSRERIIAWLHDIVEDTNVTTKVLLDEFGIAIADAVEALTRGPQESNKAYMKRVSRSTLARRVKLIDIADNLSNSVLQKDYKRAGYYASLLQKLLRGEY